MVFRSGWLMAIVLNGGALSVQVFRTKAVDESASKAERVIAVRSHDAFGARRSPTWGDAMPVSFPPSQASMGSTGLRGG